MDIKERLKSNLEKMKTIHQRLQALDQERQDLLQEALRIDGEVRILKEMEEQETKGV